MKQALVTFLIIVGGMTAILAGAEFWVRYKNENQPETYIPDYILKQTDDALKVTDGLLENGEPAPQVYVPNTERLVVSRMTNKVVPEGVDPAPLPDPMPKVVVTEPIEVEPPPVVTELVEPVYNKWIAEGDNRATIQIFDQDHGVYIDVIRTLDGELRVAGRHSGIEIDNMTFRFQPLNQKVTLKNTTSSFDTTIKLMIRNVTGYVTFSGNGLNTDEYSFTLKGFTSTTKQLRR